ncbi:hypothetical protein WJX84_006827 [Apatococcus fuscideae]|uniref:Uncharacterized protein n=1 Tax=Apatococcus fuscideae TaxID=2026836 RepID=A0AAW1T9F5_9CHLO
MGYGSPKLLADYNHNHSNHSAAYHSGLPFKPLPLSAVTHLATSNHVDCSHWWIGADENLFGQLPYDSLFQELWKKCFTHSEEDMPHIGASQILSEHDKGLMWTSAAKQLAIYNLDDSGSERHEQSGGLHPPRACLIDMHLFEVASRASHRQLGVLKIRKLLLPESANKLVMRLSLPAAKYLVFETDAATIPSAQSRLSTMTYTPDGVLRYSCSVPARDGQVFHDESPATVDWSCDGNMSRRSDPKYSDKLSLPADPKLSSRSDASENLRTSDAGEGRLQQLGYQQEFVRGFSAFTNFGISFSIMSLMTGVTGGFNLGYVNGGPVVMVYGWIAVCCFSMTVALSLAEICSAYPTAGGLYYWSAQLAGPADAALASWVTGWFNLLGQAALTSVIAYTQANQIANMILLGTGGALAGGYAVTNAQLLGIFAAILVCQALLNMFGTRILSFFNAVSVFWQLTGAIVLIILIPTAAPKTQSAKYVFTTFYAEANGEPTNVYIFLIGLLYTQFTINGYDASAHMTEETRGAERSGPLGIVTAVGSTAVVGWIYTLSLLFSVQDPDDLLTGEADGYVSGQIIYDVFKRRCNSAAVPVVIMGIPAIAMFLTGMSSVTANSRVLFAFARDDALPLSRLWKRVDRRTRTPLHAVWLMTLVAFLIGLPMLKDAVAFAAVSSISVIGLYITYGLVIFFKLFLAHSTFKPGPFYLGKKWSFIINVVALTYVLFITAVFIMPTAYPVNSQTLNWAPVAVGIVLVWTFGYWLLPVIGARRWFKGPPAALEIYALKNVDLPKPLNDS